MSNFYNELKNRKVTKAIISYSVVVFILFQLVEIVFPIFEFPAWTSKFVIILLIIGFPIVFFISWFFDFSRDGIKVDNSNGSGTSNISKAILLVLIVSFLGYYFFINDKKITNSIDNKFIAVLPFDNFSENSNDMFLSDGMTEDITMQLAKVKDINVISRTSVMKYKNEAKNIKNISKELGASFILEGSVRRIKENIRIVTQLIDANTDKHIWAESFDTNIENILEVPKKISEEVAIILIGTLSNKERKSLNEFSTKNQKAHNHYIIAENLINSSYSTTDPKMIYQAIDELEKSIEYDPNYINAYTMMAEAHLSAFWLSYDRTKSRLDKAKKILEKIETQGQNNPSYHQALGWYYYRGFRNYALALESFNKALDLNPNYSSSLMVKAFIYRRIGKYDDAIALFNRALTLDPNNYNIYSQLAYTKMRLGEFDGLEEIIDNGLPKSINNISLRLISIHADLEKSGDIEEAINSMDELYRLTSDKTLLPLLFDYYLSISDYQSAEKIAKIIPENMPHNRQYYSYKPLNKHMAFGILYHKLGKSKERNKHLNIEINNLKKLLSINPGDYELHRRLGLAYGYMLNEKNAIYELKLASSMLSIEVDALYGPFFLFSLSEIYDLIGEKNESKEILELLRSMEAGILNYDYTKSWRWKN
tara:strand:- start:1197 stop:3149 length:1953 start_codon:yes stop_codon:yes gene_type:complete